MKGIAPCLLLAVAIHSPLRTAASQGIQGVVVATGTGSPIEGASILAVSRADSSVRHTAISDRSGQFGITPLAPGAYSVLVRRIGFSPAELSTRVEASRETALRLEMNAIPLLLDTVRTRASTARLSRLTSGSEWFLKHLREGKGYFTSGNGILLTRMDACDYLSRIPGLTVQRASPPRGEPFLQCHDDRYIVSASSSRCLRTFVDRHHTISRVDSAGFMVRTHLEERAAIGQRVPARRPVRRREPEVDTFPRFLPLTTIAGIEVFRTKAELPDDFSIPMPTGSDPDSTMRCAYALVWTWNAW